MYNENEIQELTADQIDMVNGAGLTWTEVGNFLKAAAAPLVQLVIDIFDDEPATAA
ncbi:hypothetical protein [Brevundimonas sp. SL130]|uniref:hypothetical protein n=1 Tax=Brevundimonas sp. SL130 TaxID=2995143 RepID=UPI00226CED32|nr:hypothetical protein [Brevundimonas sp. SL130]WAC61326.1 hypothetical protein OU998_07775 [Brevundimonas sp. SL130]